MIVDCVPDTSVLLYAVSRTPAHLSRKTKAIDLIENRNFGTSAQRLQEFYVNATRKADLGMTSATALEWIEHMEETPCCAVNTGLMKAAIALSARYRISYWDSAIIAAAEVLGAPVIYSEALNHGQVHGAVTAINPFTGSTTGGALNETPQTPIS